MAGYAEGHAYGWMECNSVHDEVIEGGEGGEVENPQPSKNLVSRHPCNISRPFPRDFYHWSSEAWNTTLAMYDLQSCPFSKDLYHLRGEAGNGK